MKVDCETIKIVFGPEQGLWPQRAARYWGRLRVMGATQKISPAVSSPT